MSLYIAIYALEGVQYSVVETYYFKPDQDSRESDARSFIPNYFTHSINWKVFSHCIILYYIATQFQVHAISSKKMSSRDRLPEIV